MKHKLSFNNVVWRCVLSNRLADRIKYGRMLNDYNNTLEDSMRKITKSTEDMIDKLVNATEIIKQQDAHIKFLEQKLETAKKKGNKRSVRKQLCSKNSD